MSEIENVDEGWLLKLFSNSLRLRKVARWLIRLFENMLLSRARMKVVPANCFPMTITQINWLLYASRLLDSLKNVPGDIVECGVFKGESFAPLCLLVRQGGVNRHLWGFDSFEGLPEPKAEDFNSSQSFARKGILPARPEMVLNNLRNIGLDEDTINNQVTLIKGWFAETLPEYSGAPIALLHIDADLYESYKVCLENLWPKIVVGGIVAFDEYHDPEGWPGAKKAVDEYFSGQPESVKIYKDLYINRYYAVKLR